MVNLPEKYCENMKELLQEEYTDYIDSLSEKTYQAIRINTKKISLQQWEKINPFRTSPIPWVENGFYIEDAMENGQSESGQQESPIPSRHPYYYAGLYYIQEPSAMIPASLLPITPGDKVLDLCAAPGGKATELGAKLQGHGLLVANDISVSRTMALAKNLQIAGIQNCLVTAETPEKLASVFTNFFDKVLIDAPCSGEGMFRREPRMVHDWEEKGPAYYAKIQKEILAQAYQMLKPGGKMVYSTCTFSLQEDEAVIEWFLDLYQDMKVCPVERKEGFLPGRPEGIAAREELKHCVRIFPHKAKGEGHFAVLLQKGDSVADTEETLRSKEQLEKCKNSLPDYRTEKEKEKLSDCQSEQDENNIANKRSITNRKQKFLRYKKQLEDSIEDLTITIEDRSQKGSFSKKKEYQRNKSDKKKGKSGREKFEKASQGQTVQKADMQTKEFLSHLPFEEGRYVSHNNQISFEPLWIESLSKLRIVHKGVAVCEIKQKTVLSHQLALCLKDEDFDQVIDFQAADPQVIRYLKGESIQTDMAYRGNVLVCVDGFGLGWCQGSGTTLLKNKYYPGWRYQ